MSWAPAPSDDFITALMGPCEIVCIHSNLVPVTKGIYFLESPVKSMVALGGC